LFLACRYRRATLHAAAVLHRGRCVLLAGEDGAGKSTLAYACLRSGFGLVAEDIVFVEDDRDAAHSESAMQAWGVPWRLHLLPDAIRFFPELRHAAHVEQMNGEKKLRVSVRNVRSDAAVTHATVWGVCSLGRSDSNSAAIGRANPARVRDALTHIKGDPLLDRAAMAAAADRLLAGRLAHLEVGADPNRAVETLRKWMESG
jgi:hypothetical protein